MSTSIVAQQKMEKVNTLLNLNENQVHMVYIDRLKFDAENLQVKYDQNAWTKLSGLKNQSQGML